MTSTARTLFALVVLATVVAGGAGETAAATASAAGPATITATVAGAAQPLTAPAGNPEHPTGGGGAEWG